MSRILSYTSNGTKNKVYSKNSKCGTGSGPDFLFLIKNCSVCRIVDKSMEHVGIKEIVPYQLYVPPLGVPYFPIGGFTVRDKRQSVSHFIESMMTAYRAC